MSQRMKHNSDLLRVLACSTPKQRKAILATCHVDLIKCLAEISLNVLKGVVPINGEQKKKLRRYKSVLRALADKRVPLKKKKEKLNQRGGNLLSLLLPPVLSTLGSLLLK